MTSIMRLHDRKWVKGERTNFICLTAKAFILLKLVSDELHPKKEIYRLRLQRLRDQMIFNILAKKIINFILRAPSQVPVFQHDRVRPELGRHFETTRRRQTGMSDV